MKFKITKKTISNIIFTIAIVVLIYPPTRVWVMRQIAFSPGVESVEDREQISTYQWNLRGVNTSDINFETLKGKVIFVNFWATWCPPCKAEMPMIQKLYNDYKDKVAFVFVTNENRETVQSFFEKNQYHLPVYNAISIPPKELTKSNSIPASYLIDKSGDIVVYKVGAADWNSRKTRMLIDNLLTD